jgi:transcriptional antiterminator RfaH
MSEQTTSGETNRLAPGERWYVAQTQARRELLALDRIEAQSFRAFCPYVMRTVRHARQSRTVKSAFFPGYLFVALDTGRDRWRSVNGTLGVLRLVAGGDGAPIPAPPGVVETLMQYLDEAGVCRFDRDLAPGQPVRVIAGPLAQTVGVLVRLDPKGRARVLLEILGGRFHATLERSALEAA